MFDKKASFWPFCLVWPRVSALCLRSYRRQMFIKTLKTIPKCCPKSRLRREDQSKTENEFLFPLLVLIVYGVYIQNVWITTYQWSSGQSTSLTIMRSEVQIQEKRLKELCQGTNRLSACFIAYDHLWSSGQSTVITIMRSRVQTPEDPIFLFFLTALDSS